jgi:hypothetical protein
MTNKLLDLGTKGISAYTALSAQKGYKKGRISKSSKFRKKSSKK